MIKIRVPATSANLGAGFDCMGLALGLYNEVIIEPCDKLTVITDRDLPTDRRNMVVSTIHKVMEQYGYELGGVKLTQINNIPKTSGLGSSAACVVAGTLAANELMGGFLSHEDIVDICSEMDGHPDNVVPAIEGGITASVIGAKGRVSTVKCLAAGLRAAVMTPDFPMSTVKAREILPTCYSRADLVYSLSRAVVTFGKLMSKDYTDLAEVMGDRIHTPYRKSLIKGYDEVSELLYSHGAYSVYLSGAGPTIAALCGADFQSFEPPKGWTLRVLDIPDTGYQIIR